VVRSGARTFCAQIFEITSPRLGAELCALGGWVRVVVDAPQRARGPPGCICASRNYATMILLALAEDKTGGTELAATPNIDFSFGDILVLAQRKGIRWKMDHVRSH
jgi:hypothetical protein